VRANRIYRDDPRILLQKAKAGLSCRGCALASHETILLPCMADGPAEGSMGRRLVVMRSLRDLVATAVVDIGLMGT
jgi:hypothetical protein